MPDAPYSIGHNHWPGLGKLVEEMGELNQVLGKLVGTGGDPAHWDGTDLYGRLVEEIGDVRAAISFFTSANDLDRQAIEDRWRSKLLLFTDWHCAGDPL